MSGERDWKQYESQIFERLKKLAGDDAEVEFDASVRGRFSRVDRQVDVFVRGDFGGNITRATMAVDCKCFSRNVDVKDVETFMGLVDDVGTDFGLLVTTEGRPAKPRAQWHRLMRRPLQPHERAHLQALGCRWNDAGAARACRAPREYAPLVTRC